MSRIGKKPVVIPAGVTVDVSDETLKVKGPKGELTLSMHPKVKIEKTDTEVVVKVSNEENKQQRALWGLYRALINNMVNGVVSGFTKILEINGVGYKAEISGKKLILNLG